MKNLAFVALAALAAFIGYRIMSRPSLQYFKASEFGIWWPFMNKGLLLKLDAFREVWGFPVEVSKAPGGIGRHGGEHDASQHNIDKWGEVRAVDIFPKVPDGKGGYRYIKTGAELKRAHQLALQVGMQGVGSYTDTMPGYMLHVDNRQDENNHVEQWSRVSGNYLAASVAWS